MHLTHLASRKSVSSKNVSPSLVSSNYKDRIGIYLCQALLNVPLILVDTECTFRDGVYFTEFYMANPPDCSSTSARRRIVYFRPGVRPELRVRLSKAIVAPRAAEFGQSGNNWLTSTLAPPTPKKGGGSENQQVSRK